MNEENKRLLQQKFLELQILEQQIKEVYQQQQILNNKLQELTKLEESLSDLEQSKENKNLFAQIGPRVFLKTELKDSKHVFVDIGANIITEKTIPEAKKLISSQLEELNENVKLINQHLVNASIKAQKMQEEMQALQEKSETNN